jgi:exopolyphosphatase/guanosine-5'-triphosphate,3'-diphosphate pyrophosphatase
VSADAVISIGTNSTRMLMADLRGRPPHTILARSIGTRIGEGLREHGVLSDAAIGRTLNAVRAHFQAIEGRARGIFAIATSALRRADNGAAFARQVEAIVGVPLDVLSGDQEAVASFRGARTAVSENPGETIGVIDSGGGSTEYAVGSGKVPEHIVSCEIGAVRLTEACPQLAGDRGPVEPSTIERARTIALAALAPIGAFVHVDRLVLVGGSATNTVALVRGHRTRFGAAELKQADLNATFARLSELPLDRRKHVPGMNPQRADILPAGLIVLDAAFALTGHDTATATGSDLLLGYMLMRRESDSLAQA